MHSSEISILPLKYFGSRNAGRKITAITRSEIELLKSALPPKKQYLIEYFHRIQDTHGHISADHIAALAEALKLSQVEVFEVATFYHHFDVVREGETPPPKNTVRVCNGLSCAMAGAGDLFAELEKNSGSDWRVIHAPCVGQCDHAPMAVVNQTQIKSADVGRTLDALNGRSLTPGLETSLSQGERGQLLNTCGAKEPFSEVNLPKFPLLEKCISGALSLAEILSVLDLANLRGLGGAGFPAGRKWKIVRGFKGARALVVNADEGEPGTFKDRFYLERNPWQFWEGVLIAAWAVEAQDVYVYLRDEYHDVRSEMTGQLELIREYLRGVQLIEPLSPRERGRGEGTNGRDTSTGVDTLFPHPNPLPEGEGAKTGLAQRAKTATSADAGPRTRTGASRLSPNIELRRGSGAYICGEESALIESIEGKRGIPRLRPPYIAEVGVFGRPTLAHNVETLYWIPEILSKGAAWWNAHGRNGRVGLRSFSVSGRVKNPGVKLAPAGISVLELIDEFCGGMADGHTLYGYLPGGASGGILPASLDHVPLDFDTLQPYGCFIGSAAVIVLSQHDRARDAALNMMQFFEHESCGQCTPCRAGTAKAAQLMAQPKWDEALLKELSQTMMDASICGLGQAAPNPLLCAMKYFPQEFL
jgi:formate dehydrogenase beta subunit